MLSDQMRIAASIALNEGTLVTVDTYSDPMCPLIANNTLSITTTYCPFPVLDLSRSPIGRDCTKKISSSSLMVGFCHLTDSHHNHHGQKPTMVGICHGGNMLGNHHHHFYSFLAEQHHHPW